MWDLPLLNQEDTGRDYTKSINELGQFVEKISVLLAKVSNHSCFYFSTGSINLCSIVAYSPYFYTFTSTKMVLTLLAFIYLLLKETS